MDADERLDEENRAKMKALFESLPCSETATERNGDAGNVAYVMKCLCVESSFGRQPTPNSRHGTVVDHVRLFRNRPEHRWKYRVHEQILPALKTTGTEIYWTDIVIHHVGYQEPALTRCKLERNLRILHLDHAEHSEDPYILFNLGWAYLELGKAPDALPFLGKSLLLSHPADSIVKKLYALLVEAHSHLGQRHEAMAACRAGRARCPGDPELLYLEGQLLRDTGQVDAAIGCFRRLITHPNISRQEITPNPPTPFPRSEDQVVPRAGDAAKERPSSPQFGSVEVGFTGYLARNQLAHLYYGKGLHAGGVLPTRCRPMFCQ
jgi:tetratricopeptide (TPR) repeat protein